MPRPTLAVVGRRQQPIHHSLVGVRRGVLEKLFPFLWCGRQPRQVEMHPAQQGRLVRFRGGFDVQGVEFRQNEAVHRVPNGGLGAHRGRFHFAHRLERPVTLILGALGNPLFEHLDLRLGGARLFALGRRHHLVFVVRKHPLDQRALIGFSGKHGFVAPEVARCPFKCVQAQIGLPLFFVRPVALKTGVREDRSDFFVEPDPLRARLSSRSEQCNAQARGGPRRERGA